MSLGFLALLVYFCGEILVQVLRMRPYIYLHGRPMDRRSVEARRDLELESQGTMITAHCSQAARQVLQGQRQVALGEMEPGLLEIPSTKRSFQRIVRPRTHPSWRRGLRLWSGRQLIRLIPQPLVARASLCGRLRPSAICSTTPLGP